MERDNLEMKNSLTLPIYFQGLKMTYAKLFFNVSAVSWKKKRPTLLSK
jgi:hypothetical protein